MALACCLSHRVFEIDLPESAFRWPSIERRQTGIEAEDRSAIGTDDLIGATHVEIDMRMILRRFVPDTRKLSATNAHDCCSHRIMKLWVGRLHLHHMRPVECARDAGTGIVMIEFADKEEIGSLAGKVPSSAASSNSSSLSVLSFVGLMQLSQLASVPDITVTVRSAKWVCGGT
jgi:hypothetical protein